MDLFDWLDEEDEKSDEFTIKKEDVTLAGELFKDERPLSVTELSGIVKTMVEGVGKVVVQGEISNLSTPASGHIYFKIKDARNTVNAVIWKSAASKMKFKPEEGAEVILTGKMSVFSARSEYQLNVTKLEPSGLGSLMQMYNKLKEKFEKEGLFESIHKQAINKYPKTIAVVTSKTGDVFYDILHRIEQRYPCRVLLFATRVQGEGAELEIAQAIKNVNILAKKEQIDTLILARGGGSVEDLWTFNTEEVVRSVFASDVPVVSAIGHEPDVTLVDYVADLRAPTPTGAAELSTQEFNVIKATVNDSKKRLVSTLSEYILKLEQQLDYFKMKMHDSTKMITELDLKFNYLKQRLIESSGSYFAFINEDLKQKLKLLESLSVDSVLQRGFAYIQTEDGNVIKSSKTKDKDVVVTFKDGSRKAEFKDD